MGYAFYKPDRHSLALNVFLMLLGNVSACYGTTLQVDSFLIDAKISPLPKNFAHASSFRVSWPNVPGVSDPNAVSSTGNMRNGQRAAFRGIGDHGEIYMMVRKSPTYTLECVIDGVTWKGSMKAKDAFVALKAQCQYTYSPWSDCANGKNTRTVVKKIPDGQCDGIADALERICPPCDLKYSDWGPCQNGRSHRTVKSRTPDGCRGEAVLEMACSACDYQYTAWGPCDAGIQHRALVGAAPVGCSNPPVLEQACTMPARNCIYSYSAWGPCVNGEHTRTVVNRMTEACPDPPVLKEPCTNDPIRNPLPDTTASDTSPVGSRNGRMVTTGMPGGFISQGFSSAAHRERNVCEEWHVLVLGIVPKKWTIGEATKEVSLRIDAEGFSGTGGQTAGRDTAVGAKDLIAVNDSVWLELKSTDSSFSITANAKNVHRSLLDGDPVKFSWNVRAIHEPATDSTALTLVPWTMSCNTGRLIEGAERPYTVNVHVSMGGWIDRTLAWLESHLTRVAGLLAVIAGILGYFNRWHIGLAGLFKKKDKSDPPSTTGGVNA